MSNVIDLGVFRIGRKEKTYFTKEGQCRHAHLETDSEGDVVRCADCKTQVSAFWALDMLAHAWRDMIAKHEAERAELEKAKQANLHLIAARNAEQGLRKRDMVPACPHCNRGVLPEDGFGFSLVNRALELRRREAEKTKA